jgi:hypothetical protein
MEKNYWQIAAGSVGRDYSEVFIKYGIAFVGGDDNISIIKYLKEGDVIVLKRGLSKIVAAGSVVSRNGKAAGVDDKEWLRDFDGWELPAYCYVDWHVPKVPIETEELTRTTIQALPQERHRKIADDLLLLPVTSYMEEPAETRSVSDSEILDFLIAEGLRPGSAEDLTTTFNRIRLLAKYYFNKCQWRDVREHETRTFLAVPLLLALGWSEQQLKIEFPCSNGKIDIAGFNAPYHKEEKDCILIVETKDFSSGLDYAPSQAHGYAADFPSCGCVVVTNGYCCKSYRRNPNGGFQNQASAYLNILQPKDRYPVDPVHVDGCLGVLRDLLPKA